MSRQHSDHTRQTRRSLIRSLARKGIAASAAIALGQRSLDQAAAAIYCGYSQCEYTYIQCEYWGSVRTGRGRLCKIVYGYESSTGSCDWNYVCGGPACVAQWGDYSQTACPTGTGNPSPNQVVVG